MGPSLRRARLAARVRQVPDIVASWPSRSSHEGRIARRSVDAILFAARDVFAEDSDAGIAAVAERAGVHRATLYRHFPSRDALQRALEQAVLDDVEEAVVQIDLEADDLLSEVERLIRRIYEVNLFWRTYGWAPGYSAGTDERRRLDGVGGRMSSLFAAAQDDELLRQDLDRSEMLATFGGPVIYLTGSIADGRWTLDQAVAAHDAPAHAAGDLTRRSRRRGRGRPAPPPSATGGRRS